MLFAEMDSPISIVVLHPYGRRRGENGRTGAKMLNEVNMFFCPFIMNQKYKLIPIELKCHLFFEEI